jgi:broad specificity phosphatase PhoE
MSAPLIIVRHGNTFREGEPVVWVGGTSNPPLTEKGAQQAELLGVECATKFPDVKVIYHGPLLRTVDTAKAISSAYPVQPRLMLSEALKELDYGHWSGLSDDEVKKRFGNAEYDAWQKAAVWPPEERWGSRRQDVANALSVFLREAEDVLDRGGTVLAVTSNGIAREMLRAVGILDLLLKQGKSPKLRTGAYGVLHRVSGEYKLVDWNIAPPSL